MVGYAKHHNFQFGEYIQVHEAHDNTMQDHVIGAIALCPIKNSQGTYYFMIFNKVRCLNHQQLITLPLPQEFINGVQRLALREPSGTTIHDWNQRPLIYVTDSDEDKPTYSGTYDEEEDETDGDENAPTTIYNDVPAPAGVTDANFWNLQQNSGFHENHVEDNDSEEN